MTELEQPDNREHVPSEMIGTQLKCGNCGRPAYAQTFVSAGNELMPGLLCAECARVHKAEIVWKTGTSAVRGRGERTQKHEY